ncbi:hypothetical protein BH11PLA2_BH11PLA2_43920 [soil metagenome]
MTTIEDIMITPTAPSYSPSVLTTGILTGLSDRDVDDLADAFDEMAGARLCSPTDFTRAVRHFQRIARGCRLDPMPFERLAMRATSRRCSFQDAVHLIENPPAPMTWRAA